MTYYSQIFIKNEGIIKHVRDVFVCVCVCGGGGGGLSTPLDPSMQKWGHLFRYEDFFL